MFRTILASFLVASCMFAGCSRNSTGPGDSGTTGAFKALANSDMTGAQITLTNTGTTTPAGTKTISAGDTVVNFSNLAPGSYTITVSMPDGRSFSGSVNIEDGKTYDMGSIRCVDPSIPSPIMPYPLPTFPEYIAWHWPLPDEKVVIGENLATVCYNRDLVISFTFTKPLQKKSIINAFSLVPQAGGEFSWDYGPVYIAADTGMYFLEADGGALMPTTGTGGVPYRMPIEVYPTDTNLVYGFSYRVPYDQMKVNTTYSVTISSAAQDSSGTSVGPDYSFRFHTVASWSPYPYISVTPAFPSTVSDVQIQLVLGISQSPCPTLYTSSFTRNGNSIYLSYQDLPANSACILCIAAPYPYGPVFRVGNLPDGQYSVYTSDSVFVGGFSVSRPAQVMGRVIGMANPLSMMPVFCIPGVTITAKPMGYYAYVNTGFAEEAQTVTDSTGAFTLVLSGGCGAFSFTAEKAGYYPQTFTRYSYLDTLPSLTFELIDTAAKPLATAEFTVLENGAAVESAYVYVQAGYAPYPVPLCGNDSAVYATGVAQSIDVTQTYAGYTNASGKLTISNVMLTPFIEFDYSVLSTNGGYANGTTRLNRFVTNAVSVELQTYGIMPMPLAQSKQ